MPEGYETLTYRQIGERLGVTPDAARMKSKRMAKKGRWRILPSNHPNDTVYVEVPAEDLVALEPRDRPEPVAPDAPITLEHQLLSSLREAQARVNELTDLLMAEKSARVRDAAELAAAEAREIGTAAELRRALQDLAAAKMQIKRIGRPWWKRLWDD